MILSMVFLFLMILLITALLFYLFCFFLPALKAKYDGISTQLATELHFSDGTDKKLPRPDFSKVAFIAKVEENDVGEKRLNYLGEKNCMLFHRTYTSEYTNPKVCIGFGDCMKVCPQNAIKIIDNRAVVGEDCNGCGKCISYCPENLISLIEVDDSDDSDDSTKEKKDSSKGFKFWSICYRMFHRG